MFILMVFLTGWHEYEFLYLTVTEAFSDGGWGERVQ